MLFIQTWATVLYVFSFSKHGFYFSSKYESTVRCSLFFVWFSRNLSSESATTSNLSNKMAEQSESETEMGSSTTDLLCAQIPLAFLYASNIIYTIGI